MHGQNVLLGMRHPLHGSNYANYVSFADKEHRTNLHDVILVRPTTTIFDYTVPCTYSVPYLTMYEWGGIERPSASVSAGAQPVPVLETEPTDKVEKTDVEVAVDEPLSDATPTLTPPPFFLLRGCACDAVFVVRFLNEFLS